jgi:phosphoglycolate phosphatase
MNGTSPPAVMKVDAVLFDKDGTLFDFHATWSRWAEAVIDELSGGDAGQRARIAGAIGFDLAAGRFDPASPVIAGTHREASELLVSVLSGWSLAQVEDYLARRAAHAPLEPPVPLVPFLEDLAARGLQLGVVTNDTEAGARAHLRTAGIEAHFDFIAGFDSGHGAKPEPGPLLAFARAAGHAPARVAMVGDSTHDLIAGRAAGMQVLAVLTGMAEAQELAQHADAVLPDIGHIPRWLTT